MPLANRHDLMDDYVMERIRFRLLKLKEFEEKSTTRRRHIPKLSSNTSEQSTSSSNDASMVTSMFASNRYHARTELEELLYFDRPRKRSRKNKREIDGTQLFGRTF